MSFRAGWAGALGLGHLGLALGAGLLSRLSPAEGVLGGVIAAAANYSSYWISGALGLAAWLLGASRRGRLVAWSFSLLLGAYVVIEMPAARYYGAHLDGAWLAEAWRAGLFLSSSLSREIDVSACLLIGSWAIWHWFLAYLGWSASPTAPAQDAQIRRLLFPAVFLMAAPAAVASLSPTAAPQHPLVALVASTWDSRTVRATPPSGRNIEALRFGEFPRPESSLSPVTEALRLRRNRPNVVLVVLESVGARQVAAGGQFDARITPTLRRLQAEGGVLFDAVYVNYPSTFLSTINLLTGGFHPTWTGAADATGFPWQGPLLARDLRQSGYQTALFAAPDLSYLGLDRILLQAGFDEFKHFGVLAESIQRTERLDSWGGRDDRMIERAVDWLARQAAQPAKPFFLEFHSNAPHHPYAVPADFPGEPGADRKQRYQRALSYADSVLGSLLAELERTGQRENTLVVVTGDHGDGFGEHGAAGHRADGYDESVRSFALFAFPPGLTAPQRSARVLGSGDLYHGIMGVTGAVRGPAEARRDPFAAQWEPRLQYFQYEPRAGAWGLRDGRWKFIGQTTGEPRLFDLAADPDERHNLAAQYPERVKLYDDLVAEWFLVQDERFTSRLAGFAGRRLTKQELTGFGLKELRVGRVEAAGRGATRIVATGRFNPREPVILQALWFGFPSEPDVDYVWRSPSGSELRQTSKLPSSLRWLRTLAPLPAVLETGRWSVRAEVDGQTVGQLDFAVDPAEPLRFTGDRATWGASDRARFQALEVGDAGSDHRFVARGEFAPASAFTIRSTWAPGLVDEFYRYVLISPKGQRLAIPLVLAPGSVAHTESITPPVPLWEGQWTVVLESADKELGRTSFRVRQRPAATPPLAGR